MYVTFVSSEYFHFILLMLGGKSATNFIEKTNFNKRMLKPFSMKENGEGKEIKRSLFCSEFWPLRKIDSWNPKPPFMQEEKVKQFKMAKDILCYCKPFISFDVDRFFALLQFSGLIVNHLAKYIQQMQNEMKLM